MRKNIELVTTAQCRRNIKLILLAESVQNAALFSENSGKASEKSDYFYQEKLPLGKMHFAKQQQR